jgi:hypothetical protein
VINTQGVVIERFMALNGRSIVSFGIKTFTHCVSETIRWNDRQIFKARSMSFVTGRPIYHCWKKDCRAHAEFMIRKSGTTEAIIVLHDCDFMHSHGLTNLPSSSRASRYLRSQQLSEIRAKTRRGLTAPETRQQMNLWCTARVLLEAVRPVLGEQQRNQASQLVQRGENWTN